MMDRRVPYTHFLDADQSEDRPIQATMSNCVGGWQFLERWDQLHQMPGLALVGRSSSTLVRLRHSHAADVFLLAALGEIVAR